MIETKKTKITLSMGVPRAALLTAAIVMTMVPANVRADNQAALRFNNNVKTRACLLPDGKPRPIYGCARLNGPADKSTMPETAQLVMDRQSFHFCHARTKGGGAYNPTVGWGTYIDTPEELKAGKCPTQDTMREWFMRDIKISYDRGLAQARTLGNDNACMVRTLAATNHQVGDLRRKYPNTWAKLTKGETCAVALEMLTWSWYQQSCDRTLDSALAFDAMAGGCKVRN